MIGRWHLVDERAEPNLRRRLGLRLQKSDTADFAVARIRLRALDFSAEEVAGPARWRVLLGELDAAMLLDAREGPRLEGVAAGETEAATALGRVRSLAGSGRLEVRSAGLGSWVPDFAVLRGPAAPLTALGAIYFGRPPLIAGPAFTLLSEEEGVADRLVRRFDALWEASHDVLPAIVEVLEQTRGVGG